MGLHKCNLADYFIEITRGHIGGVKPTVIIGRSDSITTIEKEIWDSSVAYTYLTSSSILQISSTSLNDISTGTGAKTIIISGLDGNYNEINEVVTLNGNTNVPTTKSYLRIFYIIVDTAGSIGCNDGIITAKVGVVTYAQINIMYGRTAMALYTVPAGKTGYVYKYSANTGKGADVEIKNYVKKYNKSSYVDYHAVLYENNINIDISTPTKIIEKTDISVKSFTSAGTKMVTVLVFLLIYDN